MPRVQIDLDNVESSFQLIEPGRWLSELMDCTEEESSTGNPMLVWHWEIGEGPSQGQTTKTYTSLLDHALQGLKDHMIAFGATGGMIDLDTDRLIGRKAKLVIATARIKNRNTGEDMDVSRVNAVLPPDGGANKPGNGRAAPAARRAPAAAARGTGARQPAARQPAARTNSRTATRPAPAEQEAADDLPF